MATGPSWRPQLPPAELRTRKGRRRRPFVCPPTTGRRLSTPMRASSDTPNVASLSSARDRKAVTRVNRLSLDRGAGTCASASARDPSITSPNGTIDGQAVSHALHCRQRDMMSANRSSTGAPPNATALIAVRRPRGDAVSSPVIRNVGHTGRHSPHVTHESSDIGFGECSVTQPITGHPEACLDYTHPLGRRGPSNGSGYQASKAAHPTNLRLEAVDPTV